MSEKGKSEALERFVASLRVAWTDTLFSGDVAYVTYDKDALATVREENATLQRELAEASATKAHHLKMLDGAVAELGMAGFSADDYGGTEDVVTATRKLRQQRDGLKAALSDSRAAFRLLEAVQEKTQSALDALKAENERLVRVLDRIAKVKRKRGEPWVRPQDIESRRYTE